MLTGQTAELLQVETVHARAILAVENWAVFRHLVEVAGLPDGVGCIWLHGQRGLEKRLLARIVQCKPIPIYVWTDIDVWGIYIQDEVARVVGLYTRVLPVHMEPDMVTAASTPQPLTELHHSLLQQIPPSSRWYRLAHAMLDADSWVEQEEMLGALRGPSAVDRLLVDPSGE